MNTKKLDTHVEQYLAWPTFGVLTAPHIMSCENGYSETY